MHMIILGAPGAGKGTQAKLIIEKYHIPHISTGDMFREAVSAGTNAGKKAESYMKQGLLVPDEVTIEVVKERLLKKDCEKGFLLDGFPRNLAQAKALAEITNQIGHPLEVALNLSVDEKELLPRIVGRRMCRKCGASFHVTTNPPKKEGVCDLCGGELYQRDDDNEASVKTRMATYHAQTAPLIDYYTKKGILKEVVSMGEIKDIFANIEKVLEAL